MSDRVIMHGSFEILEQQAERIEALTLRIEGMRRIDCSPHYTNACSLSAPSLIVAAIQTRVARPLNNLE